MPRARRPKPTAAAKRREAALASAVELLTKAIGIEPQNATAHFYLGLALERQGKRPEAIEHYRFALKCRIPAPAAALYLARLLLRDDPKEALSLARRAAEAYPQSTRARHMLMVALIAAGQRPEATLVGQALLNHDPSHPVTLALLDPAPRPTPAWAEAEISWLKGGAR